MLDRPDRSSGHTSSWQGPPPTRVSAGKLAVNTRVAAAAASETARTGQGNVLRESWTHRGSGPPLKYGSQTRTARFRCRLRERFPEAPDRHSGFGSVADCADEAVACPQTRSTTAETCPAADSRTRIHPPTHLPVTLKPSGTERIADHRPDRSCRGAPRRTWQQHER